MRRRRQSQRRRQRSWAACAASGGRCLAPPCSSSCRIIYPRSRSTGCRSSVRCSSQWCCSSRAACSASSGGNRHMSALEINSVTKRFGSLVAVRDVSLAVGQGELRAMIGPNGAGKTTFFNLISGFFPPTSGSHSIRRRRMSPMCPRIERVGVGMGRTFQITEIFPELTVFTTSRIAAGSAAGFRLPVAQPHRGRQIARDRGHPRARGPRRQGRPLWSASSSHGDQRVAEIAMTLALNAEAAAAGRTDRRVEWATKRPTASPNSIRRLHREIATPSS